MRSGPGSQHFSYTQWEDWQAGLYNRTRMREPVIDDSRGLLANPAAFAVVLNEVAEDWPISTAQHLSDVYQNHQPWCGRSACCYEFEASIPEVNAAWALLTPLEKVEANRVADAFTYAWRSAHMLGQMRLT